MSTSACYLTLATLSLMKRRMKHTYTERSAQSPCRPVLLQPLEFEIADALLATKLVCVA